jgi:1,2-diacylglycerol 3-alpha-glucosyltransferase
MLSRTLILLFRNLETIAMTSPIKIFFPCSGLGNITRGYESFTRQCFDALATASGCEIFLYKGGGENRSHEISVWNLPRERWFSIQVSRFVGRITGRWGSYYTEQLSFFLGLLPHLQSQKPDIVYFSDEGLGNLLWHWRNYTKASYRLLFSNGGPTEKLQNLQRWDYVHQIAPIHLNNALNIGLNADRQQLIPGGTPIPRTPPLLSPEAQKHCRQRLGLPLDRPIVLSVASIDKSHKRIDYLIRSVSQLSGELPFTVMLGHQGAESAEIIQLAQTSLGKGNFQISTVAADQVEQYYQVADIFVLPSLREGLPRALPEALSYGLPCLAHDYEVAHYALGPEGYYADFSTPDGLTQLLQQVLQNERSDEKRWQRHQFAYERFSWEMLSPEYLQMFRNCMDMPMAL